MTKEGPSPGWSSDRSRRDSEYAQIAERSSNALRRLSALAAEWDEFVADVGQWAANYAVGTNTENLLLRLVLLPGRLHEVGAEDFGERSGREYGDLELRCTSLLARKLSIESDLAATHDDFHAWARRNGVELVEETAFADTDLDAAPTEPCMLTAGSYPLPPNGYVLNSISCRNIGNNRWRTVRKYCKIKKVKPPA
jgi:hypothetical protein